MKFLAGARIALINVLVLVVMLLACEGGFRLYRQAFPITTAWFDPYLRAQPYVMFTNSPGIYDRFPDGLHGGIIRSHIKVNNYGFPDDEDFDLVTARPKASHEKVVLVVGGSSTWGAGATSNETIVHGQLAKFLNEAQRETKYTVINLAMRGWIAQQEAVGLDLWGRLFDPDWIVIIDGGNDAPVACTVEQGLGNPSSYQLMRFFIDGYMAQPAVPLFRGSWENDLIRVSALYRALTGREYIPPPRYFNPGQTDQRYMSVTTPIKVRAVRDVEQFYLLSEQSMIERFARAKMLLTTQPFAGPFEADFGDFYSPDGTLQSGAREAKFVDDAEHKLDIDAPDDLMCNIKTGQIAIRYFLATMPSRLNKIVASYKDRGRDIEYLNLGRVFPDQKEAREANFADEAHMKDGGHAIMARRIATDILARDDEH